jgi:hypothetical protein
MKFTEPWKFIEQEQTAKCEISGKQLIIEKAAADGDN